MAWLCGYETRAEPNTNIPIIPYSVTGALVYNAVPYTVTLTHSAQFKFNSACV